MKRYGVRLSREAAADLENIYRFVRMSSSSAATARTYLDRIRMFLYGLDIAPQRGTRHDDIREGLRIVGFERRISVAFVVEDSAVVILRILSGGQELRLPKQ